MTNNFSFSQEPRKNPDKPPAEIVAPEVEELRALQEQGLVRTGRFFGGLIDDIKRKAPWYNTMTITIICFYANQDPMLYKKLQVQIGFH